MRSALIQALLPIGALAAALKPSGEAITARNKIGLTPGQRLPGYVTTSNWTSEDLVGMDLEAYPDIFRPAYDSDPEATRHALRMRDVDPSLQARDEVTTDARISSKRIDWGCDGDIQKPIEAAVAALCNNGACVEGNEYLHPVKWTHGASLMDYHLVFKASGWYNGVVRHYLIEGLQSTSTEETWSVRDVHWQYGGPIGGGGGGGVCAMTEFASNLQIHRHVGEGAPHDRIVLTVELRASPEVCLVDTAMGLIEDNLRAVGPGFFGTPTARPNC